MVSSKLHCRLLDWEMDIRCICDATGHLVLNSHKHLVQELFNISLLPRRVECHGFSHHPDDGRFCILLIRQALIGYGSIQDLHQKEGRCDSWQETDRDPALRICCRACAICIMAWRSYAAIIDAYWCGFDLSDDALVDLRRRQSKSSLLVWCSQGACLLWAHQASSNIEQDAEALLSPRTDQRNSSGPNTLRFRPWYWERFWWQFAWLCIEIAGSKHNFSSSEQQRQSGKLPVYSNSRISSCR